MLMLLAVMLAIVVNAQIPANIMEVLEKCNDKMDNPAGMVVDMNLKTKVVLFSINGKMKLYTKGDKSFSEISIKAMGHEMRMESGFDGQQNWDFKSTDDKDEKDSLIITKATKAIKNDYSVDLDFEKLYKKAKMKEKGLYYEIEFSERIDPEQPKKMKVKIAKNNYYLREVNFSEGSVNVTMTVTKVTVGARDSVFQLDMKRYKDAVVIRK